MNIPREVLQEFGDCMEAAVKAGETEPTAMTVATPGLGGGVAARMVLLKAFDEQGFVFYTNLESNKGRQISASPQAALVFYWKTIARQVLVEGRVELLSGQEADDYFASRDRRSQLGAWASKQSQPMKSRDTNEEVPGTQLQFCIKILLVLLLKPKSLYCPSYRSNT